MRNESGARPALCELHFVYSEHQRQRFRNRELSVEWAAQHPSIFDAQDVTLATGPQAKTNHFFEWLAAVRLFDFCGYLSLVEKYDCRGHVRKHQLFRKVVGERVFTNVMSNRAGIPDLVVYSPDLSDWFFAEVKGGPDYLRDHQLTRMQELWELTGKRVLVLQFRAETAEP